MSTFTRAVRPVSSVTLSEQVANQIVDMNRAYQNFFGDALPARTTVQVGLGTILVEIDAIAVRSKKDHGRVKVRESATRRSSK